jgi:hypothetical protein
MVLIIIALGLAMIVLAALNVILDEKARVRPQAISQPARPRLRPYRAAPDRR